MFKTKLLILFLINILLIGCISSNIDKGKFTVSTTTGDKVFLYDNILIQYLNSMGLYDETNFDYLIKISPNKTEGVFITNIDKNSDRKKITLDVSYKISKRYLKTSLMCDIFVQNYTRSSSYIIASGEFNASNIAADDEIFENLVDIITNDFIDDLIYFEDKDCNYRFVRER